MKSKVFYTPVQSNETQESRAAKAVKLARTAGFLEFIKENRSCAVKTHFGEGDNIGYVRPPIAAAICGFVKEAKGRPFLTDTNTLYRGSRSNAVDHVLQAYAHGFTPDAVGAPVIIADGLHGADQVTVEIEGGKHFKEIRIASALHQADSSIVLTHVKGHCVLGFGGSIKNVGMGCAARAGKLAQHQGGQPKFDEAKCVSCGACVRWCPTDALSLNESQGGVVLASVKCIGCGECLALCPADAIGFEWLTEGAELAEKVCEHVLGFHSTHRGRIGYINFVTHLTQNCDCFGTRQEAAYPDVGILASTDIIAVDKAAADLSVNQYGEDIWAKWWPESRYKEQFAYGEKLGLGTAEYELIKIG